MKGKITVLIIFALLVTCFFYYQNNQRPETPLVDRGNTEADSEVVNVAESTYSCDEGEIEVVLSGPNYNKAKVTIGNNQTVELRRTVSASGTKYSNGQTNDFVFFSKGNTAFIEEKGVKTYNNCQRI